MTYAYVDNEGKVINYTDDMLKNVIYDKQYYQDKYYAQCTEARDIRKKATEFFRDRYEQGNDEIICSLDDVNDFLDSIRADKLKKLYTVTGTVSFTITDVEAESDDDANDIVTNDLHLSYSDTGSLDEWNVEIDNTSEQ